MPDTFDASATALAIEQTAKILIDNHYGASTPIENAARHDQAGHQLSAQFEELSKNPEHLKVVGQEMEKLSGKGFSALPYVDFEVKDGQINSIGFTQSFWDFDAPSRAVHEKISW